MVIGVNRRLAAEAAPAARFAWLATTSLTFMFDRSAPAAHRRHPAGHERGHGVLAIGAPGNFSGSRPAELVVVRAVEHLSGDGVAMRPGAVDLGHDDPAVVGDADRADGMAVSAAYASPGRESSPTARERQVTELAQPGVDPGSSPRSPYGSSS